MLGKWGRNPRWMWAVPVSVAILLWQSSASAELATGQYSSMRMCLERTFLNINVISLRIQWDTETQRNLGALVAGQSYSEARAQRIVRELLRSNEARATLRFEHDVELGQFLGSVKKGLREARRLGWISSDAARWMLENLGVWFAQVRGRDLKSGDRLTFSTKGSRLVMTLVNRKGARLIHKQATLRLAPRAMLAIFFVPGSGFRAPLIKSLFGGKPPDC